MALVKSMSNKTISKNFAFVISFVIFSFLTNACFPVSSQKESNKNNSANQTSINYSEPKVVGEIKSKEIKESSGLAASKCTDDVFWTHNDSGDDAFIFAINSKGKKLATIQSYKMPKILIGKTSPPLKTKTANVFFLSEISAITPERGANIRSTK